MTDNPADPIPPTERSWADISIENEAGCVRSSKIAELCRFLNSRSCRKKQIERGSLFKRSTAKVGKLASSEEIQNRLTKIERALEIQYLDSKQAEADKASSEAVKNLLSRLGDIPNACIRVGSLLVLKYESHGNAIVLVRTLSQIEIRALEKYPELQANPDKLLEQLSLATADTQSALPE